MSTAATILLDCPIDPLRPRARARGHGRTEQAVAALILIGACGVTETMGRLWWPVLLPMAVPAVGVWLRPRREAAA